MHFYMIGKNGSKSTGKYIYDFCNVLFITDKLIFTLI